MEEKQSYDYIEHVITQYKKESQGIIGSPKFDIWVQQGTSSHRFDIMDKSEFNERERERERETNVLT